MREIKFRAWDTKRKLWVNPAFLCIGLDGKHWAIVNERVILPADEEELKHVVFLQYTGLKDSKGVEIYENDIFNLLNKDGKIISRKNVVELADFLGGHYYQTHKGGSTIYEVIGNLYDNPGLLEA